MKIAIVGWGLEGQSAYRYYGPDHEYLIVNEEPRDDFPPESDRIRVQHLPQKAPIGIPGQAQDLSYLRGIDNCDKIVFQPTSYFNLQHVFGDDDRFWAKTTTVYNIFFEACPTKNIIGVTGTKGKGTTSTLIAKLLESAGKTVHLGGNIGTPMLDILPDIREGDWVVWELANFQLKNAEHSPHIAVCLMIVPEHLDWHPSLEDYVEAKANIFRHQKPTDIAIYFADNRYSKKIAGYSPGRKVPYFSSPGARVRQDGMIVIGDHEQEIIHKTKVKLLGEHNLQNICAAATAVFEALGRLNGADSVFASFVGLEHRLEFVREFEGVKYYDDSFGTTPDTVITALKALDQPKILIIGGHDKGDDYEKMASAILDYDIKHVVAIGVIADRIARTLQSKGFQSVTTGLTKMPDMIADARKHARPGDAVLLASGTSSFGLFKDYKDRGQQFKQAVRALV